MKPRIAYLVSQYPAISHTFILREILFLKQQGFDIQTASINAPDRPPERLTFDEKREAACTQYIKTAGASGALKSLLLTLATHPVGVVRGLVTVARLARFDLKRLVFHLFYFVEALLVGQWMHRHQLAHLHVHFATPASTVGFLTKRIFGVSFSFTVHGPDEFYDVTAYSLREKIEAADFVCCIGFFARSQLMKLSDPAQWNKFEVSPLGIDPELFRPVPFRVTPKPFEVICVGRLVPAKGQHILVSAIHELVQRGRTIHLRFVGDGPDRASLESMVHQLQLESQVQFEGSVNQDRIRELYAASDLFALASFAEGIPVVLMEAMAMEIACVTTCITGIPELIRSGTDGILVPASDVTALANAIEMLLGNPSLRHQLAQAGRQRVIEKYNLEKNTARLGEIFERRLWLMGNQGSPSTRTTVFSTPDQEIPYKQA